jgi:hypothetical protein
MSELDPSVDAQTEGAGGDPAGGATGGTAGATTAVPIPPTAAPATPNGASGTLVGVLAPTVVQPRPRRYELMKHEWWVAAVVGLWLGFLGVASILAGVWAWAVADRASSADDAVRWLGPDFTATAATSALVLAAVGGIAGSCVHSGSLFATRVGRRTFEVSYFWWYLLRPIESALVAMVFVAAIRSGLLALGTQTSDSNTTVLAFLSGALAGLFTDRVMQRLRGILGATKTDEKASEQSAPGTYATGQPPAVT